MSDSSFGSYSDLYGANLRHADFLGAIVVFSDFLVSFIKESY